MEAVEPVEMNIYQSNAYRKELSWLYFDDEPRVQERQQVKDQQSCISCIFFCSGSFLILIKLRPISMSYKNQTGFCKVGRLDLNK